jgi:hypothetical protein
MPTIRVVEAQGTEDETFSRIEIDAPLPRRARKDLNEKLGRYLIEQTLLTVSSEASPVAGEAWPELAKGPYRKRKMREVGNENANMELEGDMLDALDTRADDEGIEIGFWGSEAWKADGHNKLSGEPGTAPRRRFLPGEGQEYSPEIMDGLERIIEDAMVEEASFKARDFSGVETREELYAILSQELGGDEMTDEDIKFAVARNPELVDLLDELDLLELL